MNPAGEIHPNVLYGAAEFRRRTGLGEYALRAARRRGLKVHRAGGRAFILGRDFIAWLEKRDHPNKGQTAESHPRTAT
ncbi:MAG: hypothetical protein HY000_32915 [Planctomycetes bacterium]|nr:hypothetical protein [Planctomycetota bacterium]